MKKLLIINAEIKSKLTYFLEINKMGNIWLKKRDTTGEFRGAGTIKQKKTGGGNKD